MIGLGKCVGNKNADQQHRGNQKSDGCHVYDLFRQNEKGKA